MHLGHVLRGLIDSDLPELRAAAAGVANGVYIHDRRGGSRVEVVSVLVAQFAFIGRN